MTKRQTKEQTGRPPWGRKVDRETPLAWQNGNVFHATKLLRNTDRPETETMVGGECAAVADTTHSEWRPWRFQANALWR